MSNKQRLNVSLDRKIADWLRSKSNYSDFINKAMWRIYQLERPNTPIEVLRIRQKELDNHIKKLTTERSELTSKLTVIEKQESVEKAAQQRGVEKQAVAVQQHREAERKIIFSKYAVLRGIKQVLRNVKGKKIRGRLLIDQVDILREKNPKQQRIISTSWLTEYILYRKAWHKRARKAERR